MSAPDWKRLIDVAWQQGGYFTARDARGCGISASLVAYHTHGERIRRLLHGLYRVEVLPERPEDFVARVWLEAGGERTEAVVSHRSALLMRGALNVHEHGQVVHITVPRSARWVRPSSSVQLHTSRRRLPPDETERIGRVPVAALLRALADEAAAGMPADLLGLVTRRVMFEQRVTRTEIVRSVRGRSVRVRKAVLAAMDTAPVRFRGPEERSTVMAGFSNRPNPT